MVHLTNLVILVIIYKGIVMVYAMMNKMFHNMMIILLIFMAEIVDVLKVM